LPDLHSFPTRRSSDLAGRVHSMPEWIRNVVPFFMGKMKDPYHQAWHALNKQDLVKRHLAWSRLCLEETLQGLAGEKLLYEMENSDRKSTRLNSSHDQI